MTDATPDSPASSAHTGRFPLDTDLSPLIHMLNAKGIAHRVTEQNGQQHLLLAEGQDVAQVKALLLAFERGQLSHDSSFEHLPQQSQIGSIHSKPVNNSLMSSSLSLIYRAPVTVLLIILGVIGWLGYSHASDALFYALLFVSESANRQAILSPWESQQWWRLMAPVFLHFSWWHIALNGLAMLQVGSAVERSLKWPFYLAFCIVTGVVGNIAQYYIAPESPVFGGLSGIVFALFAFNAVLQWKLPEQALKLPIGFYLFSLIWLASGFTPVFAFLFDAQMGNGAHLGGAIAGALLAFTYLFFYQHNGAKHD